MNDIVIEVRGGSVVGIYCDDTTKRFILLDWDDLNELAETEHKDGIFPVSLLCEMPNDTRRAYEHIISGMCGGT